MSEDDEALLMWVGPVLYCMEKVGNDNYCKFEFEKWAFGGKFDETVKMEDIPDWWNRNHPDLKQIQVTDDIKKCLDMFCEEFLKSHGLKDLSCPTDT